MSTINETAIKTPGVYINEISKFPPSVAQVSTAIPIFVGYTEIATLKNLPTKIFSLLEYEQLYGKARNEKGLKVDIQKNTLGGVVTSVTANAHFATESKHNMYYSMRLYFDNGGGPCYILSLGATSDTDADIKKEDFEAALPIIAAYDEPTILVFPEGNALGEGDYYALVSKAIDQCALLQDRFTLVDVHHSSIENFPTGGVNTSKSVGNFRAAGTHTTGFGKTDNLSYAAAYYPYLKTTLDYQYSDAEVDVTITKDAGPADAAVKLDSLLTKDKATFYAAKAAIDALSPTLPPSPAIAGIYAKVDGSRGVWKAPANISLTSVYDLTDIVTDAEQETMNIDTDSGKSVNAIRSFSGKGILVWGARTLDGNSSEWKYVSVRRFFIMVEESVKKATAPFVFEPNDANTWIKVRAMIENYLTLLWRQGALAGAKPEHAFYVRIGIGQTMTAQDILDGKMIVEIGMAAVRPAEFIILRFSHKMQES